VLAAARTFELEEFDLLHIVDFGGVAFSVLVVIHPHEYHMLGDETTSTYTNAPEGTQSSSTNMFLIYVCRIHPHTYRMVLFSEAHAEIYGFEDT